LRPTKSLQKLGLAETASLMRSWRLTSTLCSSNSRASSGNTFSSRGWRGRGKVVGFSNWRNSCKVIKRLMRKC
jgi:hypothetical protein